MEWAIIIGLIVVVTGIVIGCRIKIYNDLVMRRNKVKNSWAHIDAQLQRRFDLIPNLVETVRGFAVHEKQILDNVVSVIDKYIGANTNQEKLAMDAQLTSYLKSLYNVAENYPQLKSDSHFLQLQKALTEIEEDISYARQFYNDAVTIYNNQLMKFPNNMIAAKYGFKEEPLFVAVKEAEMAPKINLRYHTKQRCPVCDGDVLESENNCRYCGTSLV
jgi:LemA protein